MAGVLAIAPDHSCYLLEDLGDLSLFDAIVTGRSCGIFPAAEVELLKRSIRGLADFQYLGAEGLDFSRCYPEEAMDRRMVMWDLNYFKYCFLKLTESNMTRLPSRMILTGWPMPCSRLRPIHSCIVTSSRAM